MARGSGQVGKKRGPYKRAASDGAVRKWEEVAALYNARHGTCLTWNRVWQIGNGALKKIKEQLEKEEI